MTSLRPTRSLAVPQAAAVTAVAMDPIEIIQPPSLTERRSSRISGAMIGRMIVEARTDSAMLTNIVDLMRFIGRPPVCCVTSNM